MNKKVLKKLTVKQKRFIECYNGNATEAALEAGYSKKTAKIIGHENLTKPYILEAIKKREVTRLNKYIKTREERQQFWSKVMGDDTKEMQHRLRASELLGRSEGDFTDKLKGDIGLKTVIVHRKRFDGSECS